MSPETRDRAVLTAALMLLGTLVVVWFGAQIISRPIEGMTAAMTRLADGDLETPVPHAGRGDEIRARAGAMPGFRARARPARRREAAAAAARDARDRDARAEAERQARVVREIGTGLDRLAAGDMTHPDRQPRA